MRVENTSEGQKHLSAGGHDVVIPGRRGSVNGAAEVPEALMKAAAKDDIIKHYFESGVLLFAEETVPAPSGPTADEIALARLQGEAKTREADEAAKKAEAEKLEVQAKAAEQAEVEKAATERAAVEQAAKDALPKDEAKKDKGAKK